MLVDQVFSSSGTTVMSAAAAWGAGALQKKNGNRFLEVMWVTARMLRQGMMVVARLGDYSGPESVIESLRCSHEVVTWPHPSLPVFATPSASKRRG